MKLYFGTRAQAPLYLPEATTDTVHERIEASSPDRCESFSLTLITAHRQLASSAKHFGIACDLIQ